MKKFEKHSLEHNIMIDRRREQETLIRAMNLIRIQSVTYISPFSII